LDNLLGGGCWRRKFSCVQSLKLKKELEGAVCWRKERRNSILGKKHKKIPFKFVSKVIQGGDFFQP